MAIKDLRDEIDSGYGKRVYEDYIAVIENYLMPFFKNTHIDSIDYRSLITRSSHHAQRIPLCLSFELWTLDFGLWTLDCLSPLTSNPKFCYVSAYLHLLE